VSLREELLAAQEPRKRRRHAIDRFLDALDEDSRSEWLEALHDGQLQHETMRKALAAQGVECTREHVGTWRRLRGVQVT
jgi:hypothetical protein